MLSTMADVISISDSEMGEKKNEKLQSLWEKTLLSLDFFESLNCELLTKNPIFTFTRKDKLFKVVVSRNFQFWRAFKNGCWEPSTFKIFDSFLDKTTTFIDVGAWIGPTLIYAQHKAKRCIAFEPDPVAFVELKENVKLNQNTFVPKNIEISNEAISTHSGEIQFGSSSIPGDSMSSVLFHDSNNCWKVPATTLDAIFSRYAISGKIFIKIDIEGGEYKLLPSLKTMLMNPNLSLFLSLHPVFLLDTLSKNSRLNFSNRLRHRLLLTWVHFRLVRSLPFKYVYTVHGQKLNPYRELINTLLTGTFETGLVASHKEWNFPK